ncbi:MAG: DUF1611 domain-containing protein [Sphingomonadales bacterium]|nr:MAG: DUF1611 domain-containing protein [Sphingomonadales bacterium]
MDIPGKYLLFVADAPDRLSAKTAFGLRDWAGEKCIAQWRTAECQVDLDLRDMSFESAYDAGARTLVIGITPFGGALAPSWIDPLIAALKAGLNIASGMHVALESVPEIAEAAKSYGRLLFNVRVPRQDYSVASGRKRSGKRLLMVGTDCAVGKKYSALAIAREMNARGLRATFRATGQTGILIAGDGVPMDAVKSDFVAGAAEALSPDNHPEHWDVIEGQGSLFHPAYAGVALGLLHGSQPDAFIVCHAADRSHIDGYPAFAIPSLEKCIAVNLEAARLTNLQARCVGISLNTSALPMAARETALRDVALELGLPCVDPILTGAAPLVDALEITYG